MCNRLERHAATVFILNKLKTNAAAWRLHSVPFALLARRAHAGAAGAYVTSHAEEVVTWLELVIARTPPGLSYV